MGPDLWIDFHEYCLAKLFKRPSVTWVWCGNVRSFRWWAWKQNICFHHWEFYLRSFVAELMDHPVERYTQWASGDRCFNNLGCNVTLESRGAHEITCCWRVKRQYLAKFSRKKCVFDCHQKSKEVKFSKFPLFFLETIQFLSILNS